MPTAVENSIWAAAARFREAAQPGLSDRPSTRDEERSLAKAYAGAWEVIKAKWDKLAAQIGVADPSNPLTAGRLYRMERYQELMFEFERQMRYLATRGALTTEQLANHAISKAFMEMEQEARFALNTLDQDWEVRGDAMRAKAVAGFTEAYSPLAGLFGRYGAQAAEQARNALVSGVIAGQGTDVIARGLQRALGTALWHAQLIARTEAHRAYRESQRIFVEEHTEVYKGYVWRAALDRNTCAICWERHGTFYPAWVDKSGVPHAPPFESHPGCRCALVPRPRALGDIVDDKNIVDVRPKDTGREKFATLPEAQQKAILGPKRFELYKAGAKLSDFIELRDSGRWGRTPRLRNLSDLDKHLNKAPKPPKPSPVVKTAAGPAPGVAGAHPLTGLTPDEMTAKVQQYREAKARVAKSEQELRILNYRIEELTRAINQAADPDYRARARFSDDSNRMHYFSDQLDPYGKPYSWGLADPDFEKNARALLASRQNARDAVHLEYINAAGNLPSLLDEVSGFPVRYRTAGARPAGVKEKYIFDDMVAITEAYESVILPKYGYSSTSRWGGGVHVDRTTRYAGVFDWGDMTGFGLEQSVALSKRPRAGRVNRYSQEAYYKVIIHEAGHGMNPLDWTEYNGKYGWDEGVVEAAAQVFEEDIWSAAGIRAHGFGKKTPAGTGLRPGSAYRTYTAYTRSFRQTLEQINDMGRRKAGWVPMTEKDYFGRLLSVPSPDRRHLIRQWMKGAGFPDSTIDFRLQQMDADFAIRYN